jgi:hypothetical protein
VNALPSTAGVFAVQLAELGWASDLLVAGSLALGDYVPTVSDIDLVAVTQAPLDREREVAITALHRAVDRGSGRARLGAIYVEEARLTDHRRRHPTWTHGMLLRRVLSGITRAEIVRHGFAVFGRDPTELLPAMSDDEVRAAARAELSGYWGRASRRPWMWLNPEFADLGLVSMARARHTAKTGQLLPKTIAIEQVRAPEWLVEHLRARRRGDKLTSPRLRTALAAWRDTRRTCREVAPTDA